MLQGIKNMIKQKTEFMESSKIILDDVIHGDPEDYILLEEGPIAFVEDEADSDVPISEDDNTDNQEMEGEAPPIDNDKDIMDEEIDPQPVQNNNTDDLDDILQVNIDLKTNTLTDILPIPPDNAQEAISDDILSTRIDSGFGEDSDDTPSIDPPISEAEDDILAGNIEESYSTLDESIDNFFNEAISLGDETSADETPPDQVEPEEASGDENEVTAAVRDKVAEMDTDIPADDTSVSDSKSKIMDKLSKITKELEDAKKAVLDTIK